MNRIIDSLLRGFGRKLGVVLAGLLVAAVAMLFGGEAKAHSQPCGDPNNRTCDRGVAKTMSTDASPAKAHCTAMGMGDAQGYSAAEGWTPILKNSGSTITPEPETNGSYFATYAMKYTGGNGYEATCGTDQFHYGGGCAQRNAALSQSAIKFATSDAEQCIAGCKYKIVSDAQTKKIFSGTSGQTPVQTGTLYGGHWEYTGDTCGSPQQPPKPREEEKPKPECVPAASGQTYCTKPSGENCATSTTGRSICWQPGETGQKTDGPITQTNMTGLQPPGQIEGSTHQSTTNVTTTTNNNSSSITINNYSTNNGAPAGPSNSGTGNNPDGTPGGTTGGSTGGTGSGEGDGQDNTAGGGSGCQDPPTSSGDPLLGAIYTQAWNVRCQIEKGLGSLTGEGQCSDQGTVVAFACSGDTVGCQLALRARERGCKEAVANSKLVSDGARDQGDDPGPSHWLDGEGETPSLSTSLISVGGGGSLFPTLEFEGQSVNLDEKFAPAIAGIRMIIIAMFSFLAIMIAGGSRQ